LTLAPSWGLEVGFCDFGITGTDAEYDRDWLGLRSKASLKKIQAAGPCSCSANCVKGAA
jgi:hypothetical protein